MKGLFHFILSHSIFIAFCAAALSLQTLQLLNHPINFYRLGFIFFATLAGYNAYWMVSKWSFNKTSSLAPFLLKNKSSFLVMASAIVGMFFCLTRVHLVMYNTILTFILLALYAVPVMPFRFLHFTRKAGFLKTIVLAFAWTMVTTLIPLQVSIVALDHAAQLIFLNRFLFMLMLCIIFDKRDAAVDKIRGLQSLATDIRPTLLHFFIGLIFIGYSWISFSMSAYGILLPQVIALLLTGCITIGVYTSSMKKRGYLFYYFLVDGLMFLSALLTGLATIY